MTETSAKPQLPHLVFGGELVSLERHRVPGSLQARHRRDFPELCSAHAAWKAKAQATVDNAHMRYFIVHLHRLLDPGQATRSSREPGGTA